MYLLEIIILSECQPYGASGDTETSREDSSVPTIFCLRKQGAREYILEQLLSRELESQVKGDIVLKCLPFIALKLQ